jgi:hypothetical protein
LHKISQRFQSFYPWGFNKIPSFAELYTAALKGEKEEELNKAKEALNKELEDPLNF